MNENGFLSLIVNSDWDPQQEQAAIKTLLSRPVDGIIFVEYSHQMMSDVLERSNKNTHSERGVNLTAIPYYAWSNRGLKGMRVWIPAI